MRIGVIGLGNIGGAIAANLAEDGHELCVLDTDAARTERLVQAGARAAQDPAEVARAGEITFLSLPTPDVVRSVSGDWLAGAAPGSVLVDLSTTAPSVIRELGARVAAAGCHLVEAPLTGGARGAQARMLVFMVGGDPDVVARCRPLLEKLGRATFHVGALGLGNTAKLVNSLLAFTSTWVSLEGLSLAAKAGIDVRTMVDVVRTGGASNFYIDRMVEGIGERGRPPEFSLALAAKDAGLVVDLGREKAVPTPVAAQIAQVFVSALAEGLGARDFGDLAELAERHADVKLSLRPADAG